MKRLIRFIIVLVFILVGFYFMFINIPKANIRSKESVAEVTAMDLYSAYQADQKGADMEYTGKVLNVEGVVDEIYKDEKDSPVVVLRNDEGEPVVVITLEAKEGDKAFNYHEGDKVKIKALCSGMLMEVTLTKGLFIE